MLTCAGEGWPGPGNYAIRPPVMSMLRHAFARSSYRAAYSLFGGAALFAWLVSRGIPWWVALPAGILFTVAVFMVAVGALYTYTKVQYPSRAEKCAGEGEEE